MNIKIKKHLLLYKGYKLKCSLGKSGIRKKKKEGDLATPKGSFGKGNLYYRKDRLKKFYEIQIHTMVVPINHLVVCWSDS